MTLLIIEELLIWP